MALRHVHSKHVIHRDLKGRNIFIHDDSHEMEFLISGFGVSKVMQNAKATANTVVGSPYYMSPEINLSKPYTTQTDIWSLGCVLYEMCSL